eukprot:scaffold149388_cov19-Tisochrysis_lutea.AAC.2
MQQLQAIAAERFGKGYDALSLEEKRFVVQIWWVRVVLIRDYYMWFKTGLQRRYPGCLGAGDSSSHRASNSVTKSEVDKTESCLDSGSHLSPCSS